jgi:hypothetical protein
MKKYLKQERFRENCESFLVKHIIKDDRYQNSSFDTEVRGIVSNSTWNDRTVFYETEKHLKEISANSVIICDDGSGEIADFVFYDFTLGQEKIILVHCKLGYVKDNFKPGADIKYLYEVIGQATKTAHLLWSPPSPVKFDRWENSPHTTLSRVRSGSITSAASKKKLKDLYSNPHTRREIWVIQPRIDITKLLREFKNDNKIFTLLCGAINTSQSNNAFFKFFANYKK